MMSADELLKRRVSISDSPLAQRLRKEVMVLLNRAAKTRKPYIAKQSLIDHCDCSESAMNQVLEELEHIDKAEMLQDTEQPESWRKAVKRQGVWRVIRTEEGWAVQEQMVPYNEYIDLIKNHGWSGSFSAAIKYIRSKLWEDYMSDLEVIAQLEEPQD